MEKRKNRDDMEIEEIRNRLTQQDKLLNEILISVRGSIAMGIEGVRPMLDEMKQSMEQVISDIAHLQRWKKMTQQKEDNAISSRNLLYTRILAVIGGVGTVTAVVLGIKEMWEFFHK
jgi:hypothetical protein